MYIQTNYDKTLDFIESEIKNAVAKERKEILKAIRCDECGGSGARGTPSDYSPCSFCDGTGFNVKDGCCNDLITD